VLQGKRRKDSYHCDLCTSELCAQTHISERNFDTSHIKYQLSTANHDTDLVSGQVDNNLKFLVMIQGLLVQVGTGRGQLMCTEQRTNFLVNISMALAYIYIATNYLFSNVLHANATRNLE
jgi:hypothetical protein